MSGFTAPLAPFKRDKETFSHNVGNRRITYARFLLIFRLKNSIVIVTKKTLPVKAGKAQGDKQVLKMQFTLNLYFESTFACRVISLANSGYLCYIGSTFNGLVSLYNFCHGGERH
jgi:hypothetical protein